MSLILCQPQLVVQHRTAILYIPKHQVASTYEFKCLLFITWQ